MYPYKDFLISLCKVKEKTTNKKKSNAMISQGGMTKNPESSFDAIDEQTIPRPTSPTSQANGSKNLQRSYCRELLSQAFDEDVTDNIEPRMKGSMVKLPSMIGNDQQLSRNMTAQKITASVNAELSANDSGSTSPYQFVSPSGFSKKIPFYQIACKEEGALSHGTSSNQDASLLYSLDNLVKSAIDFQVESATSNTQEVYQPLSTHGGYPFQGTLKDTVAHAKSCPRPCPCVCHSQSVLSPYPVFNEERRSVIMAPVGENSDRTSHVTHTPLQIEDNLNTPLSFILGQEIASRAVDVSDVSDDSDEEEHFFRKEVNGLKVKFKLTENDWKLIQMNKFPSGGRSLGGAWTSIFKRGVRESNPWCSLRFKNNHVRTENSRKKNSAPFFRGAAECKRPECAVRLKFVIKEEWGKYVKVLYIGNVCHKI